MSLAVSFVAASLLMPSAMAQDSDLGLDPSLPIPTLSYDRPPPDYSYELAFQVSYGSITYWQNEVAPWPGVGIRGGWGRNLPDSAKHRIGVNMLGFLEGPFPVHLSAGVEPQLAWDFIGDRGILFGAGIGPGAYYNSKIQNGTSVTSKFVVGAEASARVGRSQSWSRVGRRLFFMVEPKIRYMDGKFGPTAAIVIGSGKGY